MNPADPENPIFTRYILDDNLPASERAAVERWIRENPSLQDEVHGLQHVAETLRAQAPVHDLHLTAPQRARVMTGPPRRAAPTPRAVRPAQPGMLAAFVRLAALIALLAGAFMLGRYSEPAQDWLTKTAPIPNDGAGHMNPGVVETAVDEGGTNEPKVASSQTETIMVVDTAPSQPVEEVITPKPIPSPQTAPVVADAAIEEEPVETRIGGTTTDAGRASAAKVAAYYGVSVPAASGEFVNTTRRALDQALMQPGLLRPVASTDASQLAAKPLAPGQHKASSAAPRRKPDLHIHSWSYETASCPWNPRYRLLKVTIQLPADQEAVALGNHEYPVEVVFDANHVREYRRVSTRYLPPAEVRSAGSQTLWYEFLPNGAPATSFENGKRIATVQLPGGKFTTQTVGPFDASRLLVLDRGRGWQEARGDFQFETAVVALSLLLDGKGAEGGLNQQMVLDLAQTSKKEGDADGNRVRFVNSLKQLGRLAGR